MTTVLVFGTFDLLHEGHMYFLKKAKALGDRLIAIIGRDRNVEMIKKRKPHDDEGTRLDNVSRLADKAILGRADMDYMKTIEKIEPDIICLGYDQDSFGLEEKVKGKGIRIVRLEAYLPEKYKSSIIRKSKFE